MQLLGKINSILAGVVAALLLSSWFVAVLVGGIMWTQREKLQPSPDAPRKELDLLLARDIALDSPPSSLSGYEFPSNSTPHSGDWLIELIYVLDFQLADASLGPFSGGSAVGYAALLASKSSSGDAADPMIDRFLATRTQFESQGDEWIAYGCGEGWVAIDFLIEGFI